MRAAVDQTTAALLFALLRSAVCGEALTASERCAYSPERLAQLTQLAGAHDVAHLLALGLKTNGLQEGTAPEREIFQAVYRCEAQSYALDTLSAALDEAGIAFLPLKGAVLRRFYPEPWMRTSCDLDILVHEETLDAALACLEARGYRCGERNYHDVDLYAPSGVHVELHFSIQENMPSLDRVLRQAWRYAVPTEGGCHVFSEEFFVFHLYAHMAYHFLGGGCGLRSLLDIWVMEHRMGLSCARAQALLERAGIYRFAQELSALAERCFTVGDGAVFSDPVLQYILRGGVYGSSENHFAVGKLEAGGASGYAWRRLFLPYRSMVVSYPILKKAPCLLPLCWVARWAGALFGGKSGRLALEMSYVRRLPDEELEAVRALRARLGL